MRFRNAGRQPRGVAAVDRQQQHIHPEGPQSVGLSGIGDGIPGMGKAQSAGGEGIAEKRIPAGRVPFECLMRCRQDMERQARHRLQRLPGIDGDEPGPCPDPHARHVQPGGGHDEGEIGKAQMQRPQSPGSM